MWSSRARAIWTPSCMQSNQWFGQVLFSSVSSGERDRAFWLLAAFSSLEASIAINHTYLGNDLYFSYYNKHISYF